MTGTRQRVVGDGKWMVLYYWNSHMYITFKISSTLNQLYLLIISSYPIYYNGMLNWSMPIQVSFLLHIAARKSLLKSDHVTWLLKILKSLPMLSEVKAMNGLQKVLHAYMPHPNISKFPISYTLCLVPVTLAFFLFLEHSTFLYICNSLPEILFF